MPKFDRYDYETIRAAIPPPFCIERDTETGVIQDPIVETIYRLLDEYRMLDSVKKAGKRRMIEEFIDTALDGMSAAAEAYDKACAEQYALYLRMRGHRAWDWLTHKDQQGW